MRINYPSQAELQEVFEYVDGELWRKAFTGKDGRKHKRLLVKNTANSDGYCDVNFKRKAVRYHTIVLILNYGDAPKNCIIDHIDGNRTNNRLDNLRWVTKRANGQNWQIHRNGKLVGCYFHNQRKKWVAVIRVYGKRKYLGRFDTELEAHTAYMAAVEQIEKESVV